MRLTNERAQKENDSSVRVLELTESVLTDDQRQQIACKYRFKSDS